MSGVDPVRLSEAVVVWTGWQLTPSPEPDEQRLVATFGSDAALDLMPKVRELHDDFYTSEARHTVADLKEMSDVAAREFRARHPDLSEEAVEALAWCYSFDYR